MDILQRAREINDEVIANRRYLHEHPELGFALDGTVAFVKKKLTEMGYQPQDCGDHGITACVGGTHGGKCILLRADMDALPMNEESGLPFASKVDGAAHTCGHDTHTAMLLGAAKLLKEMEKDLPGTVKLMFQPAEEVICGAKSMVDGGVLENPKVDAALGIHSMAVDPLGVLGVTTGGMFASADLFRIRVTGKGGHGAMPSLTIDPVNVAAHILINLQELIAREIPSAENAVLTIGSLQGGTASNIIPPDATLMGTLRTYNPEIRSFMLRRLEEISAGTAQTFRAQAEVEILSSCPTVICDSAVTATVVDAVRKTLGEDKVNDHHAVFSGSEDFGYVSEQVPTTFFVLGSDAGDGTEMYAQHHPKIVFNEQSFVSGVAAYCSAAVAWLEANR
jgi:amidohydrolase